MKWRLFRYFLVMVASWFLCAFLCVGVIFIALIGSIDYSSTEILAKYIRTPIPDTAENVRLYTIRFWNSQTSYLRFEISPNQLAAYLNGFCEFEGENYYSISETNKFLSERAPDGFFRPLWWIPTQTDNLEFLDCYSGETKILIVKTDSSRFTLFIQVDSRT